MPSQPDWRRGRPQDRERTPAEDWPADSAGGIPFGGRPYLDSQPYGDSRGNGHGLNFAGGLSSDDSQPHHPGQPGSGQVSTEQAGTGQWGYQNLHPATQYLGPRADTQYQGQHGTGMPCDTRPGSNGSSPFGDAPYPGDPAAGPDGPGPGGPGGRGGHRAGRRWSRIGLSIAAVALVVAGLGAYGVARMHHSSSLAAVQDSAPGPCASQGQGSGQASGTARPCTAGAGSPAASSPAASASASPRHHKKHHHMITPTPSPTATATPRPAPSSSAPSGTSSSSAAAQVLALINQARAQAGLPAYTISSGLDTSSRRHTKVMAGGCGLSHECAGEASLGDRLTAAGVQWTAAGENIGEGGPVPGNQAQITKMAVSLTRSMLEEKPPDDGHRQNILSSSFTHVGIYVFRDSHGTVWITQDFAN